MDKKIFTITEAKSLEEEGQIEAIITTSELDKDGEVLISEGCDFKEFLKTGTVFYNHDQDKPVAKTIKLQKSKGLIKAVFQFAKNDPFAQKIYNLVKEGIIKGISVGFETIEDRLPTKKDLQEFGKGTKRIISKFKMHEYSVVTLPCNASALITNVKKLQTKYELTDTDIQIIFGKKFIKVEDIQLKQKELPSIDIQIKKKNLIDYKNLINIEIKKIKGQLY